MPRLKKLGISQSRLGSKRTAGELRAQNVELNSISRLSARSAALACINVFSGDLNLLNQTEVDVPKVAVETA